jgi:hypothetical protein
MKTTSQKLQEAEEIVKQLKLKLAEEKEISELINIPELGIKIQKSIHHKNKSYNYLVNEFGKEYLEKHLPTYAQLQFLRNSEEYRELLGLTDSWEFVKQEDEISRKNGYVARFCMGSGYADLICGRDADGSYSVLGVRFAKKIKEGKND